MSTAILQIKDIYKIYPNGTMANKKVSVDVQENHIHAIVGENGAGKTTLMKIIFGIEEPQSGEILFKGEKVNFRSPNDAIAKGIGMVHQHLMLAPELTVAENMVLGTEPKKGKIFLDTERASELTLQVSKEYGLDVPIEKRIEDLPLGIRQRVEILKALFRNAELLILDEPTSVLTPQETDILFSTLKRLKEQGKTILFISHKLSEVKRIADTVTVMRDARVITTENANTLSEHDIAYLMVGRNITYEQVPQPERVGEPILETRGLSYTDENGIELLKKINLRVRAGEILGLAGVEGNGQSELIRIITGLLQPTSGAVFKAERNITGLSPRAIRELGLAHIPQDRMEDGVAEHTSIEENCIVDRYYKAEFSSFKRLKWRHIAEHTAELIRDFKILATSSRQPVASLSGGNIQKVVVARELSSNPEIIIAAQPTRGVDVGSEEHLHSLLLEARDAGKAVFMISADLDEIMKLSSRINVIYNGEIVAHFPRPDRITARDLGPYMLGVQKQDSTEVEQEEIGG